MKYEALSWRKFVTVALASVMLVGVVPIQASAASSVNQTVNGVQMVGSVRTDSSSATATTLYYGTGATRKVTARVYYWYGPTYYMSAASGVSTSAAGVSATATKKLGGAEVVGGKGEHYVRVGATTWQPTTTTGTIPSSYVTK